MLKLTNRYANSLLEYAEEQGLDEIYRQALLFVMQRKHEEAEAPGALGEFLRHVPKNEITAVMYKFLDLARQRMDIMEAEVISAVPLTPPQLAELEAKLIRIFHKQMDITTTIDPSLLGGLRIIVGNTVIDESIKRKLQDMKINVYKGVYFKQ